jgi:hypothetical protein
MLEKPFVQGKNRKYTLLGCIFFAYRVRIGASQGRPHVVSLSFLIRLLQRYKKNL